jgi:hypothetical protein
MTVTKKPPTDDFNSKDLLEKIDANLHQPDKFSKIFCETLDKQAHMQSSIKEIIKLSLKNDVDTQEIIRTIVWKNWKTIGSAIFALFLAFIGGGYFLK